MSDAPPAVPVEGTGVTVFPVSDFSPLTLMYPSSIVKLSKDLTTAVLTRQVEKRSLLDNLLQYSSMKLSDVVNGVTDLFTIESDGSTLRRLKKEQRTLERRLKELNANYEGFMEHVKELEDNNRELKTNLDAAKDAAKCLQCEVGDLKKQSDAVKSQLSAAEIENKENIKVKTPPRAKFLGMGYSKNKSKEGKENPKEAKENLKEQGRKIPASPSRLFNSMLSKNKSKQSKRKTIVTEPLTDPNL